MIVQHVLDTANIIKKNGNLIASQVGINAQQWLILLLLAGDENHELVAKTGRKDFFVSEIADVLCVSRPKMTSLISLLLEQELITQTDDAQDKRKKLLSITSKGQGYAEAIEKLRIGLNEKILADFTADEKQLFLFYLKRCAIALKKDF
jgi:DNA-binding MarR family transcriptional regulator